MIQSLNLPESLVYAGVGAIIGFCGWIAKETITKGQCLAKIQQELTDLKQDFKDFIDEYRVNHN